MERYLNNREIIKNLSINTGTSANPVYSAMCTTSEINIATEFEITDFYVYCDAIQRSLTTGLAITLETTVKLDIENTAISTLLDLVHTAMTNGTVAQFNNQSVRFDLLTGENAGVLQYETYTADATLEFSDLGGAAEEEGEFSLNIHINGPVSAGTQPTT